MSAPVVIENGTEQHPLALEIAILKTSLARCQNDAYDAAIQHQRQSWEASKVKGRVSLLERENTVLHAELQTMRQIPHPDLAAETHPAALHAQQMSLLLREVNTKLTLTEERLLQCSTELIHSSGEATKAKSVAEGAYELSSRARAREEEAWQRVKRLELKLRAAEEETKLSNLVVGEYADLVRSLEGRAATSRVSLTHNGSGSSTQTGEGTPHDGSTTSLVDSYTEGKQGLRRLFAEFSSDSERLHSEIQEVQRELQTVRMEQAVGRKQAEVDRAALAKAWMEVEKTRSGDNSAAQMVSRYMKFSQSSINKLQDALSALKARHEATTNTLTAQLAELSDQLQSWQATAERLRSTVDDLAVDLMKETFNRRREVALRIRISSREERLQERLQRWLNRGEDILHKEDGNHRLPALTDLMQDAKALLSELNGPSQAEGGDNSSNSLSRIVAAEIAVEALAQELQEETMRRLELEKALADQYPAGVSSVISDVTLGNISMILNNNTAQTIPPVPVSPRDTQVSSTSPSAGVSTSPTNRLNEQSQVEVEHSTSLHQAPTFEIPLIIVDNPIDEVFEGNLKTSISLPSKPQDEVAPPLYDVPEQETSNSPTKDPGAVVEVPTGLSVNVEDTSHIASSTAATGNATFTRENKPPPEPDGIPHVQPQENGQEPRHFPTAGVLPELSPIRLTATLLNTSDDPEQESRDIPADSHDDGIASSISSVEPNIGSSATSSTDVHSPGLMLARDVVDKTLDQDQHWSSEGKNVNSAPHLSSEKSDHTTSHPHALLEQLSRVERRYDDLLKSFRDCHIALEGLKTDLSTLSADQTTQISRYLPAELARAALQRLDDYTEDARVELEIRKADESLLIEGYKTLLALPNALSSMKSDLPSILLASGARNVSSTDKLISPQPGVESEIETFVSGNDPNVQKAHQTLSKKLDDIQNDIALLKRLLHDPDFSLESSTSADESTSSSWSSWIRASPSFQQKTLPPSFGDIMTTSRLRHSPSLPTSRHPSMAGGVDKNDPFTALGLKVPMPSYVTPAPPVHSSAAYDNQPTPRARTVSTIYMLGIGSRTMNGPLGLGVASPRARIQTPTGGPFIPPSPKPQAEVNAEEDVE